MTTQLQRVPALRFSEFSGDWEERKLEKIVKINQGLQIPINERFTEQLEGMHFYITNEFLRKNSDKKYYIEAPSSSVVCDKSDILMTRTGNTGLVVTNVEGVFHNNFFKIKYPKFIEKYFLVEFLRLFETNKQILRYAGTSTIPDLNHTDFYRIKLNYPSFIEQQKIASFLSSVDTKIEQLIKEKSQLEKYKKGMMQKLFSQEIRFKDDEGKKYPNWEEKRLGDIASFKKGKGISKADISEDGQLACIRYGELYTVYGETILEVKSRTNVARKNLVISIANDVIIPASGETAIDIATASCVITGGIALGGDLNIIRSKENGVFLSYYLNSVKKNDIARLAQGVSVMHLYSAQLKSLQLKIPSLPEQQKIAEFISSIDDKIQQVGEELKKAKTFKKGLLQQMFV